MADRHDTKVGYRVHSMRARHWVLGLALWLRLAIPAAVCAEVVELRLDSGRTASAEYSAGTPGRPAVLLLHGFLQTRDFPTVRRLADSLAEDGYTVLTPTLSLEIDRRAQSLACEAVHTHSMESVEAEIHAWLDWLASATPGPLVALGHSAGALQILAQSSERPHPRVAGLILISVTYFGSGLSNREGAESIRQAESDLAQGVAEPREYALSYCSRYPTLPSAYLSYVSWTRERSRAAVEGLAGLPIHLVLGGADKRIDWDWVGELKGLGAQVHRVPGANHFFDAIDELDLLEAAEASLGTIEVQRRP